MSTSTSNTAVTSTTSSGMSIGLIVGSIVFAAIIIAVIVYVIKRRRNAAGAALAAPSMPSPAGPNGGMPSPTNANVNSTRISAGNGSNGRPPQ